MLEKMKTKRVHEVSTVSATTTINLCSQELDVAEEMEMTINYTYNVIW